MEVRKYAYYYYYYYYYLAWMKETFEIAFDWMQLSQLGHHWFATPQGLKNPKEKWGIGKPYPEILFWRVLIRIQ